MTPSKPHCATVLYENRRIIPHGKHWKNRHLRAILLDDDVVVT